MLYYHNFLKHAKSSSGLMLFFHCWKDMVKRRCAGQSSGDWCKNKKTFRTV